MKKIIGILACIVFFSGGNLKAGEIDVFKGKKGTINIAGGTAHIPVMKYVAQEIMRVNPDIKITIAGGGSGVGIQKVGEGLVDIGNSGRKPKETEIEKYGLKMFPWALDGVCVVLNKENKVKQLTSSQIQDIYAGKITSWKDVAGNDDGINIYTRDEASGTRDVFWKKQLNQGTIAQKANVVSSNGAMKVAVQNDPNAIGYISIGHIDDQVKVPEIDGVQPSQETAVSGEYKVVRKLYSNTKGEPSGMVKDFLNYLMSEEGSKIIEKYKFIPLKSK